MSIHTPYEALLEAEDRLPSNDDLIRVPGLDQFKVEYDVLNESGVGLDELHEGLIRRGAITEAGYCAVNVIGGGEKPIFSDTLPEVDGNPEVYLGRRLLLTEDELAQVVTTQNSPKRDDETIRVDMLSVLNEATVMYSQKRELEGGLFRGAQSLIFDGGNDSAIKMVGDLLVDTIDRQKNDRFPAVKFLMDECLQGVDVLNVQGVPFSLYPTRFNILRGAFSPFLDSGFQFGNNPDITLHPNDHEKTRRLNIVTVHLLSRGLSETGESQNGSHDQTYISPSEYTRLFTDNDNDSVSERDSNVRLAADRLIARAVARYQENA